MSGEDIHSIHVGKAARLMFADLGLDEGTILRRAKLPVGLLQGEGRKISIDEFYDLWSVVTTEANDPELPLKLSEVRSIEYFDPAFFAALCSPNLNVALMRLSKFKSLVGPFGLDLIQKDQATLVEFFCKTRDDVPLTLALTELLFLVNFARLATRQHISPSIVTVSSNLPDKKIYEAHLGCQINESSKASVTFSARDLKRPFLTHDHNMWSFFEPQLRQRIKDASSTRSIRERVETVLAEFIPSGRLNVSQVAQELALSKRTLQRRLSEEGTTWQQVLDGVRKSLAHHYLLNSDLGVTELSFLLGFEDPNSFGRAFKRWEGKPPEAWRTVQVIAKTE